MKRKILVACSLCLLLFSWNNSIAQDYQITHLTTADGLPSNQVYSVFKDSKGFMWFCTEGGVSRYNGIALENFTMADGLADNDIFQCREDKWGRIWFASYNGQICFYKNGKFYNRDNCDFIPSVDRKNDFIINICQNRNDSSLIILHSNSFNSYYICHKKNIEKKSLDGIDSLDYIYYTDGELFFSHLQLKREGRMRFALVKHNKGEVDTLFKTNEVVHRNISVIPSPIGSREYLLRTSTGIHNLNNEFSLLPNIKPEGLMTLMEYDNYEALAYQDGLRLKKDGQIKHLLMGQFITGLNTDRYNNLYASTYNNGAYILSKKMNPLKTLPFKVISLARTDNTFLLSKSKHIYEYNKNLRTTKEKFRFKDAVSLDKYKNQLVTISNNRKLEAIVQANKRLELAQIDVSNPKEDIIFGDIAFSRSRNHISSFNIKRQDSVPILAQENAIFQGFLKGAKKLWAYGGNGIYEFKEYKFDTIPQLKSHNLFKAAMLGKDLIFITYNDFKLQLIRDFQKVENNSKAEVLSVKKIQNLKKISPNAILFSDEKGVNQLISLENEKYKIYELRNPIKSIVIDDIYSDSTYLFTSQVNSTDLFEIDSITLPNWKPRVNLKYIVNGSGIKTKKTKDFFIKYKDATKIILTYSVLGKNQEPVFYEYAINSEKSKDTIWTQIANPEIELINPNPGKYGILFRVMNSENIHSNIEKINIQIQAPFLLRKWVIITGLLLLILGTFLITSFLRLRKEKKLLLEKEVEKKNLNNEFKALNALMNPHFIFNSLNNIQNLITKDKDKANEYLGTFSDLVRQNMQNINHELISLDKELALVRNYLELEKLRFKDKLNYAINIDENVFLQEVMLPPLSIQPLIENCIKHGILHTKKSGKIILNISENEDGVTIEIMDNGIGFDNSKNNSGSKSALNNIKKRFEVLSQVHETQYKFDIISNEQGEFKNTIKLDILYELA